MRGAGRRLRPGAGDRAGDGVGAPAPWGLGLAGAYVVLSVGLFAFFYPLYTAQVIPYSQWQLRMWFPSWI